MAEKSTRISESTSGKYLAFRDAFELGGESEARIIPRVDFSAGKFITPLDAPLRGNMSPISAADTFDLTALPSELINSLIWVGEGSVLTVAVEQSVSGGTLTVTPILFDDYTPPNVVGVLPSKTFTQPYTHRRGASTGNYPLPLLSWDVSGAHKIGLHCSAISGTSNTCRVFAWIDGVAVNYADKYYRAVSLLLPMDGDDEAVKAWDYSPNNHAITFVGNAKIDTAQSKFGGAAAYFDGSGDCLSIANHACFNFEAYDFTIEMWARFNGTTDANGDCLLSIGDATNNRPLGLYRYDNTNIELGLSTGSTNYTAIRTTTNPLTSGGGVWHHIAVTRCNHVVRIFVDGTQAMDDYAYASALGTYSGTIYIGRFPWNTPNSDLPGYIDDLRITKGVARYTANFTPPAATLPVVEFAADDPHYWRTSLLLHGQGANNSTSILDSSWSPKVMTANGGAKLSTDQYKFGSSSIYFDGNGDYLSTPNIHYFDMAALDWTMEAWVRIAGWASNNGGQYQSTIFSKDAASNRSYSLGLVGDASSFTTLRFIGFSDNTTGYTIVDGSYSFSLNTWYHIAATRKGNLVYLFVDGVCINSGGTAFSRTLQTVSTTPKVGALVWDATYLYYLNGCIQDLRITKGYARYITDFSVPTALYPSNRER